MALEYPRYKAFLVDRIIGHLLVILLFTVIGFSLPLEARLGVLIAYCGAGVLFEITANPPELELDARILKILAIFVVVIGAYIALSAPGVF